MTILYAIFFGAGLSAIAYGFIGKRVGISNQKQIFTVVGVVFVMASIFFYTILAMLPKN
ncbi:MAG: hypothetical protein WCF91_01295 [bacterium]|jgi:hypothetical protein